MYWDPMTAVTGSVGRLFGHGRNGTQIFWPELDEYLLGRWPERDWHNVPGRVSRWRGASTTTPRTSPTGSAPTARVRVLAGQPAAAPAGRAAARALTQVQIAAGRPSLKNSGSAGTQTATPSATRRADQAAAAASSTSSTRAS